MIQFIGALISGLNLGSIYALIALGYTMVYGIAKMLNFAHGDIIMVGAYSVIVSAVTLKLPPVVAILIAVVVCAALGVTIEFLAYRPLRQSPPLAVLITAIGVSYLLQNLALLIFGPEQKSTPALFDLPSLTLGGVTVDGITLLTLGVTAAIMVGNLLGAGKVAEARRTGLAITVLGALCMSMAGACMWFFMEALARFFSPDQAVQEQIVSYLFYNILSTPFTVGSMIFNGVMTGAGATLYTLVVNTSCIWLVRLPLAWLLAHIVWGGSRGVYTAMLISMIVQASAMLWVFFRKDWPGYAMRRSGVPATR